MPNQSPPSQKNPYELAEELFESTTQLRLFDATHTGRDSDVHYGICSALATVGLIGHARFRALELQIAERCRFFHTPKPTR